MNQFENDVSSHREMTFTRAIVRCLHKYADFSGRASRSEYWYWVLFSLIFCIVAFAVSVGHRALFYELFIPVSYEERSAFKSLAQLAWSYLDTMLLFYALTCIPTLAVTWRRLHDVGKSGKWYLIVVIPFIGALILLGICCGRSQLMDNIYGKTPFNDREQ